MKSTKKSSSFVRLASPGSLIRFMDGISWVFLGLGLVGAVGTGAMMPLIGPLIGRAFNSLGEAGSMTGDSAINHVCALITYVGLGLFGASILQTVGCSIAGSRVMLKAKRECFRLALEQDCTFYDAVSTGKVAHVMHSECGLLGELIIDKLPIITTTISTFITAVIIAFVAAWDVTLVAMACVPVMLVAIYVTTKLSLRADKKSKISLQEASGYAKEVLGNIRTVYSFDAGQRSAEKYIKKLDDPLMTGTQAAIMQGIQLGLVRFTSFAAMPLVLWYGGLQVSNNSISGGDVFSVLSPLLMAVIILAQNAARIRTTPLALMAANEVKEFLDSSAAHEPGTIDKDEGANQELVVTGNLDLENIHFAYPVAPDVEVLHGVSLSIPAGHTAALVGQSGSGKSTIVSLLLRLYEPTAGRIVLDGIDASSIALKSYRRHIGLVSQEPVLFASTIADNIGFGKDGASMEEIIAAAQTAQIHEFINTLPDGYNTLVGERGTQLSGGQKQRVAIARAFLKAPKIFVFDEATSALDTQSERAIQGALRAVTKNSTTITIAHRLSTIQDSQIIAVMNNGEIVEQGTHTELSSMAGVYSGLLHKFAVVEDNAELDKIMEVSEKDLVIEGGGVLSGDSGLISLSIVSALSSARSIAAPSRREKSFFLDRNDAETASETQVPKSRILSLVHPDRGLVLLGVGFAAICGAVLPLLTYCLMSITSVYYQPSGIMAGVSKWAGILTGIAVGSGLAEFAQNFCFGKVGQRLAYRVRSMMMTSLVRQDVGWFDQEENNSAAIVSRLESDALYVKGQASDNFGMIAQILGALLTGFPISFVYSWRLALIMLAVVPVMMITGIVLLVFLHKIATKSQETNSLAEALATEAITNYRVVAAFNLQDPMYSSYETRADDIRSLAVKGAIIQGIGGGFIFFMLFGIYALAFWYGGQLVTEQKQDFNSVLQGIFPVFIALVCIAQANASFPDVAKGTVAVQSVFAIIDRVPAIDSSSNDGIAPKSCCGALALRDVEFFYPQRPDVKVFNKINLNMPSGTSVALVGPSGSGKSTVVGLLLRFYDPVAGAILLDDRPLQSLNIHWLRSQIGLVAQEPILFNGTILENIRYGFPNASLEDCVSAAAVANATNFIDALPSGMHTSIGDQNMQLSGGQKQRIAIARAILTNPRILLLDEATSALDTASEGAVQKALDAAMVGRTALVIAHRLGTVRRVGRIYVLLEGRVVEEGSHVELMARQGGLYAAMVELQKTD